MSKDVNLKAVFIGDKGENGETYKRLMNQLMDDHLGWRLNYVPEDMDAITMEEQEDPDFVATTERMEEVLHDLSHRMRSGAIPWQSAGRYWGQMNAETLMPSIIAYSYAMLWNSNNVALESSMATSEMEAEIAVDFADLFGFPDGWGHITADGSVANLEGLWYARCIKSIPLSVNELYPEKVKGKDEW